MELTGVYWIPLFELLESRGFTVCLVNARYVKKRFRAQIGRTGLPVATTIDEFWLAVGRIPTTRRLLRLVGSGQASRNATAPPSQTYPTHCC